MSLDVWLIRHAESIPPGPGLEDEYTRPLSTRGLEDAVALAERLPAPSAVYSSPYLRAVQTVRPIAEKCGLPVQTIENFREHMMSPGPISHWREVLDRQWRDFELREPGGECMRETQNRGIQVLEELAGRHAEGLVLLAGHGTIISLVLHAIAPDVGFNFHLAMPNPAIYRLRHLENQWIWIWD